MPIFYNMTKIIKRKEILNELKYLNENRNVKISDIKKYNKIYLLTKRFKFYTLNLNNKNKELLQSLILENIENDFEEDTVGSWLTGCIGKTPCNDICLRSLNFYNDWKVCDINIVNIKKGLSKDYLLEILNSNNQKSDKVVVITTDKDFYGFSKEDIAWFKDQKFLKGSVIVKENNNYNEIIRFNDIEKLLRYEKRNSTIKNAITLGATGLGIVALAYAGAFNKQ